MRTTGIQLKPFLSENFAFFCVKFLLLFFQPNFFKKISDRNVFNCVPAIHTYFLVFHETTMVSKVSQKNFKYVRPKGTNIEILSAEISVCLWMHIPYIFCPNPLYPCCFPKKILLASRRLTSYPGFVGFGGRIKIKTSLS